MNRAAVPKAGVVPAEARQCRVVRRAVPRKRQVARATAACRAAVRPRRVGDRERLAARVGACSDLVAGRPVQVIECSLREVPLRDVRVATAIVPRELAARARSEMRGIARLEYLDVRRRECAGQRVRPREAEMAPR